MANDRENYLRMSLGRLLIDVVDDITAIKISDQVTLYVDGARGGHHFLQFVSCGKFEDIYFMRNTPLSEMLRQAVILSDQITGDSNLF